MSESNEYVALNPQGRSSIESIQLNQLKPMSTAIMIHFSSAALLYNLYTHIHTLHKPLKHKGLILEPHQYNPAWQMFFKYLEKNAASCAFLYTFQQQPWTTFFLDGLLYPRDRAILLVDMRSFWASE